MTRWRRHGRLWPTFAALSGVATLVGPAHGAGRLGLGWGVDPADGGRGVRARFSMCFTGGGYNCVVDGDTIWLEGVKIRIADTETHDPRCTSEKRLGDRATIRLRQLLNAGLVTLGRVGRDHDRYGRALRIVAVDGRSVGDMLVAEGLARPWDGARHPWCQH